MSILEKIFKTRKDITYMLDFRYDRRSITTSVCETFSD